MDYGYYSSIAFVGSVVVYLLAMIAHAAEWASARVSTSWPGAWIRRPRRKAT